MVNHALPKVGQSAGQMPEPGLRIIQEPLRARRRSVDNLKLPPGPSGKRFQEYDAVKDKKWGNTQILPLLYPQDTPPFLQYCNSYQTYSDIYKPEEGWYGLAKILF